MAELKDDIVRTLEIINFVIQQRGYVLGDEMLDIHENDLVVGKMELLAFCSGLQYLHDHGEVHIIEDMGLLRRPSYYESHFLEEKRDEFDMDFEMKGFQLFSIFVGDKISSLLKKYKSNRLVISESEKSNTNLHFNIETGQYQYFGMKGLLSPDSREFKVFKTLYTSANYMATYKTIIRSYMGEVQISKSHKIELGETLKSLKRKFGILPKTKKSHPDFFQNASKHGYKLVLS